MGWELGYNVALTILHGVSAGLLHEPCFDYTSLWLLFLSMKCA